MALTRNRLLLSIIFISLVLVLAFALLMSGLARAQDKLAAPAPGTGITPLTPTEVQTLRLQVRQKDALLAKQALDAAQAQFQAALKELSAEAERVKTEQHWDKGVTFDFQTLAFTPPAPPPAPAAKEKK